jgi:hypothetical protein
VRDRLPVAAGRAGAARAPDALPDALLVDLCVARAAAAAGGNRRRGQTPRDDRHRDSPRLEARGLTPISAGADPCREGLRQPISCIFVQKRAGFGQSTCARRCIGIP